MMRVVRDYCLNNSLIKVPVETANKSQLHINEAEHFGLLINEILSLNAYPIEIYERNIRLSE